MKLKTSKIQALEKAASVNDSTDLELLGTEALKANATYAKLIEQKEISSAQNSFLSLFGLDTKFFYSVTLVCESHGFTEHGLGYIYNQNKKFFLKRFRPFYMIENGAFAHLKRPRPVICSHNDYVVASSYIPSTFVEVLTEPHSVITCEESHLPTSFAVSDNSLIGRHGGSLESIPFSSFIQNDKKNLSLKSPKVDVKRLTANNVQLNAAQTAPERKGVIFYDENDDCLKYYDGNSWRILMWQEDK